MLMDSHVINVQRAFTTFHKAALTVNVIQQAQLTIFVIQIPDNVCVKAMLMAVPVMSVFLKLQIYKHQMKTVAQIVHALHRTP